MFPHLAQRSLFRILVAITLTISLLLMPVVFRPASEAAQSQALAYELTHILTGQPNVKLRQK